MTGRTITVVGWPIRLHPSPQASAAFPWVEFEDLLRAAAFPPESIAACAWSWLSNYPDRSHSTPDGRLLIPSEAARGLFDAARLAGWAPADQAIDEFQRGTSSYFAALNWRLDEAAFRAAVNEAVLRSAVCEVVH